MLLVNSVREAGEYVISKFCSNTMLICTEQIECGTNFATKVIVTMVLNNKQKLTTDSVRKKVVKTFENRQMEKC